MALAPVRTANALGSAIAVLSEDLGDLVWTNSAGAALLSLEPGEVAWPERAVPVLRQIQSASQTLKAKGRTQLLLRPASPGMGRAVLARLETVTGPDGSLALLTVRLESGAGEAPATLAQRLLGEAGLSGAMACIVSREGFVAGTASLPEDERSLLAAQGQEFLMAEEDRLTVEDGAGALSFAKVADDLVLVHLDMPVAVPDGAALPDAASHEPEGALAEAVEPVAAMPASPLETEPDAADAPRAASQAAPAGIGRLVERWHSRGPVDEASDEAALPGSEDKVGSQPTDHADNTVHLDNADALSSQEPPTGDAGSLQSDMAEETAPVAFVAPLDAEPVRFIWQIDAEGRFSSLSPEFAAIVGPRSADVIGRSFTDVATVFGFDEKGEIARLLARRDTWSGRSILWPLEGTDRRAPVDLAALPIYGRDRGFEGFRGFGVVRPAESVVDSDAIGRVLSMPHAAPEGEAPGTADAPLTPETTPIASIRVIATEAPSPFGRRTEPPIERKAVIQLDERRRPAETALSSAEEAAFRAIGAELGVSAPPVSEPPAPAAANALEEDEAQDDELAPPEPSDLAAEPAPPPDGEDAPDEAVRAAQELEDMLDALPLAVLVQMQERLVFANRRFFALTGYADLDALEEAGGLDHLVASCGLDGTDSEAVLVRADGVTERAQLHLRRVSVAGRSCLMMSFPPVEPMVEDRLAANVVDLQREVDELQAVLDTATDGIVLLDGSERLRKMNGSAEALFGLKPEQYLGLPFTDLLAPESRQVALDYIETLRDDGLAAILNDGREITAKVAEGGATIPLFVTLGRLSEGRGWCVVIRDIAQWKHAESDLVAARRQAEDASLHKSRFLANISHELRTPLNAIIGFADVMASECFGPIGHERYLEYLGDIKRSGHHLLDLVNDLLDISKIEAGKVELAFESVALNEIVAEVVSLMQPQANRERVIVRSVLPASVPPVVADRRSVRQIALNLIANAVRFTPAGGQIIASTHYGGEGEVTLRFRDSGIGMTEREIEIALTPFQQVNAGNRGRGEGTGLGLPLTKAMVEANRALFSIVSTPGEGTLVEITFPAQRVLAD